MDTIKKAGALIFQDNKLLIVKSKGKPYFISPGGKYEEGESAEECLRRELMEELQVQVKSFQHYKDYHFEKAAHSAHPLLLNFYIVNIEGEPKVAQEIETMEWLSKEDYDGKRFNFAPSFDTFIPDLVNDGLL